MRVVFDSNVLIAAFATHGLCHSLFEICLRSHEIVISDFILSEVEKIADAFQQSKGRSIEKIILGGGSAKLPGLKEYVEQNLRKEVQIADPFRPIYYPPHLEGIMKEVGPSYAVSIGMALRGLE